MTFEFSGNLIGHCDTIAAPLRCGMSLTLIAHRLSRDELRLQQFCDAVNLALESDTNSSQLATSCTVLWIMWNLQLSSSSCVSNLIRTIQSHAVWSSVMLYTLYENTSEPQE